jgi:hypothetical protein
MNKSPMLKLTVELSGADPETGADICLYHFESCECNHDYLLHHINEALTSGTATRGGSLDCVRPLHVELSVAVSSDEEGFRPAFSLDARTISRLNAAGASFEFDPYV